MQGYAGKTGLGGDFAYLRAETVEMAQAAFHLGRGAAVLAGETLGERDVALHALAVGVQHHEHAAAAEVVRLFLDGLAGATLAVGALPGGDRIGLQALAVLPVVQRLGVAVGGRMADVLFRHRHVGPSPALGLVGPGLVGMGEAGQGGGEQQEGEGRAHGRSGAGRRGLSS